ncbi:MAG: hypothetical protein VW169_12420 [Rhodospirillaceae bacterium]
MSGIRTDVIDPYSPPDDNGSPLLPHQAAAVEAAREASKLRV